ncbi:hypothetical protein [Tenacibaculum maritimum]|uniref:hypothetical protein n=1 Tax=Tenacibaculum maritimum TaxID=107401 RepID=UPI00388E4F0F
MKNLKNYGVQELNASGINQLNGWYWWLPATAMGIYLFDNRDRFIEGIENGLGLN